MVLATKCASKFDSKFTEVSVQICLRILQEVLMCIFYLWARYCDYDRILWTHFCLKHSPYRDNQVSSSFPMSSAGFFQRAQLPTVPTSKQFVGDYNFEISFGPPTDSAPKSATWTYSPKTSKLYTNIGSYCPFQFKTNGNSMKPAYIRAVAMFKGSSNLHDIVKMCANHAENSHEGGSWLTVFHILERHSSLLASHSL